MCKMCVVRELTGTAGDAYSRGFDFSSEEMMAGDPFLAALAPLALKLGGKLVSKMGGAKGAVRTMTGVSSMQGGLAAISRMRTGGTMPEAVGAYTAASRGRAGRVTQTPIAGPIGPRRFVGGGGFGRRRHGRGITGAQLRGFKRVVNLLKSVGMAPRGLARSRTHRRRR